MPDEIIGIVQAKDLLDAYMTGKRPCRWFDFRPLGSTGL